MSKPNNTLKRVRAIVFAFSLPLLAVNCGGGGGGGGSDPTPTPTNAAGTLSFSVATSSVAENVTGGTAAITVSRSGSQGTITVNFQTSNGTATAGIDYTSALGTLTFADGITSRTFMVTILDDARADGNETFNIAISAPTGGATIDAARANHVVTIVDNETSPVSINWTANNETKVNTIGGGYRVYYSQNANFNIIDAGVTVIDVPYVNGALAPVTLNLALPTGTYYVRVVAYGLVNNMTTSSFGSAQISVIVP